MSYLEIPCEQDKKEGEHGHLRRQVRAVRNEETQEDDVVARLPNKPKQKSAAPQLSAQRIDTPCYAPTDQLSGECLMEIKKMHKEMKTKPQEIG